MSRKLRFFKDQIDKAGLRCLPRHEIEPDIELGDLEVRDEFSTALSAENYLVSIAMPLLLGYEDGIFFLTLHSFLCIFNCFLRQRQLADHEHEVLEMNSNSEKLRLTYNELLEFKIVLQKVGVFAFISSNWKVFRYSSFFPLYYLKISLSINKVILCSSGCSVLKNLFRKMCAHLPLFMLLLSHVLLLYFFLGKWFPCLK